MISTQDTETLVERCLTIQYGDAAMFKSSNDVGLVEPDNALTIFRNLQGNIICRVQCTEYVKEYDKTLSV